MAKRRSKIKISSKTPFRVCKGKDPGKSSSTARKLSPELNSNSTNPPHETCTEDNRHEEKVRGDYVIDTKTATAESSGEQLIANEQSSEKCLDTKMKKPSSFRGRVSTSDKTLGTVPYENDGETCLDVECGDNQAVLYLSKLYVGSKGSCIDFNGSWLTPNEFQYVSGRETAKDWKRSIRHNGFSLKLLITNGHIELNTSPPSSAPANPPVTPAPVVPEAPVAPAPPETSSPAASVVQNKRGTKRTDSVAKNDDAPEASGSKRLYIPVKRRSGVKVGGRRRKVKARKRVAPRRPIARRQHEESPKPDIQDSDKDSIETEPRPSEILEPDVATTKEETVEDKQSEEFFKSLNLSKTKGSTTICPPVLSSSADKTETTLVSADETVVEQDKANAAVESTTDATVEPTTEKRPEEVIETFRSRLIPDETGLRIAINRQVVCMKGKEVETKFIKETVSVAELTTDAAQANIDTEVKEPITDSGDTPLTDSDKCCVKDEVNVKTEDEVDVKTEPAGQAESINDPTESAKTDIQSVTESIALPKIKTQETEIVQNTNAEKMTTVIVPESIKDKSCSDQEMLQVKDLSECTKCVDEKVDTNFVSNTSQSHLDKIHTSQTRAAMSDFKSDAGVSPPILCNTSSNSKPNDTKCECRDSGCRERSHKNNIKLSKPTTSESAILHGSRVPESRITTPKSIKESTFHDKSKYENDMLELMSMYRPVMVPCDGICPYVCPDQTSTLRSYGDSPIPYASCNSPKWPQSFPLLSGVMTPEMMLYMTQQLYYDMYNSSLYAQCASGDKSSQPKPVKRKEPEHDPDTPLDLTVKRAKFDHKISTKPSVTNSLDTPLDFSKKSSYTMDKKSSGFSSNTHTHSHTHSHTLTHPHKVSNGLVKPHGYNGVHRSAARHSSTTTCTCGHSGQKDDLRTWNVDKVCSFLKQYHGCAVYTKTFREQGIDGRLLPYLTMQHLTRTLGMQAGPALTFLDAVDQHLKAGSSTAGRYCETCKA